MKYTQTHTFLLLVLVLFLLKMFTKQNHSQYTTEDVYYQGVGQVTNMVTNSPVITATSELNEVLLNMRPSIPQWGLFDHYSEKLTMGTPLIDLVREQVGSTGVEMLSVIEEAISKRQKVDLLGMSNSQGGAMKDYVTQYQNAISGVSPGVIASIASYTGYHKQSAIVIIVAILAGMVVSCGAMYTYVYVTAIENGYCIHHACQEEYGAECQSDNTSEGCGAWLKRNCRTEMIPPPCSGVA
jgi:hypothetical protein